MWCWKRHHALLVFRHAATVPHLSWEIANIQQFKEYQSSFSIFSGWAVVSSWPVCKWFVIQCNKNTARNALSIIILPPDGGSFGNHPLVIWFMKGVFETRPSLPRYRDVRDVLFWTPCKPPTTTLLSGQWCKLFTPLVLVVWGAVMTLFWNY